MSLICSTITSNIFKINFVFSKIFSNISVTLTKLITFGQISKSLQQHLLRQHRFRHLRQKQLASYKTQRCQQHFQLRKAYQRSRRVEITGWLLSQNPQQEAHSALHSFRIKRQSENYQMSSPARESRVTSGPDRTILTRHKTPLQDLRLI